MLNMQGKIIKIISNTFTVDVDGELFETKARGKFRNDKITPMVGDLVAIDAENLLITDIFPRKNELKRPFISNIDKAFIITSVTEPKLSFDLLDKQLALINYNNIDPVVVLTKIDLLTSSEVKELKKIIKYYSNIGIKTLKNTEKRKLKKTICKNTVVFTGQSGAGKSTLLNRLDKMLDLKTSPISKSLGRGKHTTRHVELFEIAGGLVADTPGFSSLELSELTIEDLKHVFVEFKHYSCEFSDCNHLKEKNCGVKQNVEQGKILESRYKNYVKFVGELKK